MAIKPSVEDKRDGLKHKYNLTRVDGSPVDPKGIFFVLRLDYHDGCDETHIAACRMAARTYANEIAEHLPALSMDLQRML